MHLLIFALTNFLEEVLTFPYQNMQIFFFENNQSFYLSLYESFEPPFLYIVNIMLSVCNFVPICIFLLCHIVLNIYS